jgi:hypothetical protein
MKRRISPAWLAFGVIFALGAAGVLIGYGSGLPSSGLEQRCQTYCRGQGKEGQMELVYPKSMTGSRDSPVECRCR